MSISLGFYSKVLGKPDSYSCLGKSQTHLIPLDEDRKSWTRTLKYYR